MEADKLERCEEKLLKRKREILTVLDHLGRQSEDVTGKPHFDWLDRAWDASAAHTIDRLADIYGRELAAVDGALGRVRSGTFGFCLACHEPIEPSRLDLFPQTEFCRACRALREGFEAAA